nr:MAG TPA: hydrogenase/urease nickel incorporation protein [Caudoviricetes sp.]
MNNLNEKTLKELEEERRRTKDSLQRARETRERYYQEYYATHRYDFDILECEFQRLKAKETSMLVDLNKYIYGGDTIKETNYFCPNCYSKIKKEHFFCPTCGQRLLWEDIYDTRSTIEDNENVKKGE